MKPLVQHITEGLNKVDAPLLEKQVKETEVKEEAPQLIVDLANIAPERKKRRLIRRTSLFYSVVM